MWEPVLALWLGLTCCASPGPFSAGRESSPVRNSLGPAGGLSEGLCQEQHRKSLNEVPMNGESHLDGIALGIK